MIVIPAIDLMNGCAVRLVRGKKDSATVYSEEPWDLVDDMAEQGATRLHVVDLDGAFAGSPKSRGTIEHLLGLSPVPVAVGGGLRDRAAVSAVLDAGARWAVLGTSAVRDPDLVRELCTEYPDRIIVAIDAVKGVVAVEGWTESSEVRAADLGKRAADWGAAALLYTDIDRDGTGQGPATDITAQLADMLPVPVIASGGIGSLEHVRQLAKAGIAMCVIGRALYEGRFSVAEAIEAAEC